jgi:putative ABC transport system permease protein
MGTLRQDFRFGLRMLRKHPGFTAVAVITLALAIGANTAIFSAVYPVLLRPLPFRDANRLLTLGEARRQVGCCSYWASYPDFVDWTANAKSFQSLAGYAADAFTITGSGEPKTVFASMVTTNFFSTLGVTPMLGRDFAAGEDLPSGSGPTVAMITYGFWQSDFGGDAKVIGRTVRLDGRPATIIGVLPRDFELTPAGIVPVWVPLHLNNAERTMRGARWLDVIGRLAPGATIDQARAEMTAITAQLGRQYPEADSSIEVDIALLRNQIVGDIRPLLLVLFGAVVFVLLIACANVANLLLSRSLDRRREFAIRSALGASRVHIVMQLLVESLMLSFMGALLGFLGAALGVWLLARSIPDIELSFMPYLGDVGISFPVLAFVGAVTALTAIFFGLGPGLSVARTPITDVLKDESRGGTSGSQNRLRNVLVIGEIAISLVLLVGGGLMMQSLRGVLRQSPGFESDHLLTFIVNLPAADYPASRTWPFSNTNGLRFAHEFLARLRALPGVKGASATSALPASENLSGSRFVMEGHPVPPGEEASATGRRVDPDYFSVMKIPLIRGREFTSADAADRPYVVLVNQAWIKRNMANGEDPIGKRVHFISDPDGQYRQIVGVVGDVAENSLAAPAPPVFYIPVDQESGYTTYINYVVRTGGDPMTMLPQVRAVALGIDPQLAFTQPQSLEQFMNGSPAVFLRRYPFYLVGGFAALALILAMVGLYGLISYSVSQRTREIGIRMALGAQRRDVLKLTIRQGVVDAIYGVVIGLILALLLTRVMSSMLYGVKASDWITFAAVSVLLLVIAVAASYLPARRATQVDPMIALRNE